MAKSKKKPRLAAKPTKVHVMLFPPDAARPQFRVMARVVLDCKSAKAAEAQCAIVGKALRRLHLLGSK